MAYSTVFVLSSIVIFWIHSIVCQPIQDASLQFDDLTRNAAIPTLLSVCFLISVVAVIGFCVCCSNRNLKVLGKQNGIAASYQTSNNTQCENNSEFTIFPPLSAIVMQPTNPSDEKVTFEPLPEILSRSSTVSHDSQLLRVAKFTGSFGKGLDDWFDDSTYKYFPRSQLQYHQELGNCWFGQVVSGEAQNIVENEIVTKVIVKILKQDATPTDYVHFLQEIRPFRDLNHQNIVKLLGFCLEKDPYLFILEHSTVDLKTYLINHNEEAESLLQDGYILQLACNIADALQHMHDHNFVHMDLAARNCYFTSDFIIKLGDYGTAVHQHKDEYYCRGSIALPLRWCDPDSLICTTSIIETKEINKTANIWSFGVFVWELFEFGKLPYFALTDEEVLQNVVLERDYFLESPSKSFVHKERIYQIMQMCWREVSTRPTIHEINVLLNYLYDNKNKVSNMSAFENRWTSLQPQSTEHNLIIPSNSHAAKVVLKFENDFVPNLQNTIEYNKDSPSHNSDINTDEKELTKVPLNTQNLQNNVDIFCKNDILENISNDSSDVNFNECLYNKQNITDSTDLKTVPFILNHSENLQTGQQFEMTECKVVHNTFQSSPFDEVCIGNNDGNQEFLNKCTEKKNQDHYLVNSETFDKPEKEESCFIPIEKNDIFTIDLDREIINQDACNVKINQSSDLEDLEISFDDISLKANSDKTENDVCDYLENTVIEDTNCDVQEEINQNYNCKNMDKIDDCDKMQETEGNVASVQDCLKDTLQDNDVCEIKDTIDNKISICEEEKDDKTDTSCYNTPMRDNEEELIYKNSDINLLNKTEYLTTEKKNEIKTDPDKQITDNKALNNLSCLEELMSSNNSGDTLSEISYNVDTNVNDYNKNLNDSEILNTEKILEEEEKHDSNSSEINFKTLLSEQKSSEKLVSESVKNDESNNRYNEDLNNDEYSNDNSPEINNKKETHENTYNNMSKSNSSTNLNSFSIETNKLIMETIPEKVENCSEENSYDISSLSEQQYMSPVTNNSEQGNLPKCDSFQHMLEPVVVVKHCSISSEGEEYNLDDISDALSEINSVNNNNEVFNSTIQNKLLDLTDYNKDSILENSNRPGPSQPLSDHMFATCANYWNDKMQLINNSDIMLKEENTKSHCRNDMVTLEDLDTGDKKDVISCYDTFQDPFETDEVLRVDTETNIAVLLDSSQSVIGFVPSKTVDMSNKQCMIDIQDNEISSPSEKQNLSKLANSFCYNGYKTSDISTSSSCSASSDLSIDLDRQSDTSSESDVVPEAQSINNSHSYAESIDDVHFSQISSENTSELLAINDDNLSFETLENLLTKTNNTKEDYNNINNNLEDSVTDFPGNIKKTNLEIKDIQEFNTMECEKLSPNRDMYTPDFDSDTDDTSSTGTSCTSTSGSFECLYKSERMGNKTSPEIVVDDDDEDGTETSIQIFSGTWDRKATPTKSSMKSPEKKNGQMKKSVSFQEEDPPLFSYPPESEGSDDDSRGFDYPDDFFWNVDYTMYTDWDFQTSLDAEEIPEDIIEVDDPEQDDEYLSFRYKALPLRPFQVYSFTDITDDECSDSASLKTACSEFGTLESNVVKNSIDVKTIEDPCSSPVGSVPDEVCEEVIETFPHFTDISDITSNASDDDKNPNACSFEILEVEDNILETTNSNFLDESISPYDNSSLCLVIEDGKNGNKESSSSKYVLPSLDDLSRNKMQQTTNTVDLSDYKDTNSEMINPVITTEEYETDADQFEETNNISEINEAVNISLNNNFIKEISDNEDISNLDFDGLKSDVNSENKYLKKNNITNMSKEETEVPFSNVYLINEAVNDHNLISEQIDKNKNIEDNRIKIEFTKSNHITENNNRTVNDNLLLDNANGNRNESTNLTDANDINVEIFPKNMEDKFKLLDFASTTNDEFDSLSKTNTDAFSTLCSDSNEVCHSSENVVKNHFVSENKIPLFSTNNNDNFMLFENSDNSGLIEFDHSCIHKRNSVGCYDCYKTDASHMDPEFKDFTYSVFGENEFQTSQQNLTEASSSSKSTDDTSEQDSAISSSGEFSPTYSPSLVQNDFKNKDNWGFHQTLVQFSHTDNIQNDNINKENIDNILSEKCVSESTVAKCLMPIPTIVISDSDNVDNLQDCEQNGNIVLDRNTTAEDFCGENDNTAMWKNV